MRIQWIGQAAFYLSATNGARVLMDPFNRQCGLERDDFPAHVVTFSHRHLDHYDATAVGSAQAIEGAGKHTAAGIKFFGLQAFHDKQMGKHRGQITMFQLWLEGLSIVHLSDLGHSLNSYARDAFGKVDVLMVPCGGRVTLDPKGALEVIEYLNPSIAIMMAYHTPGLLIGTLGRNKVETMFPIRQTGKVLSVDKSSLPTRTEIHFLDVVSECPEPQITQT